MKTLIRGTAINTLVLSLLPTIIGGIDIYGGLVTLVLGGFILYILFTLLKPILSALSLPLHVITFGTITILINAFIFYLLTVFIPNIVISPFTFPGLSFAGFIVPAVTFNTFFAYVVVTMIYSMFTFAIRWLIDKE